jgi:hypothetical protein
MLIQTRTPSHILGRTSAAVDVAVSVPQSVSIGIGALAVSQIDYRILLSAMAAVLAGCAAVLLRQTRPSATAQQTTSPGPLEADSPRPTGEPG